MRVRLMRLSESGVFTRPFYQDTSTGMRRGPAVRRGLCHYRMNSRGSLDAAALHDPFEMEVHIALDLR